MTRDVVEQLSEDQASFAAPDALREANSDGLLRVLACVSVGRLAADMLINSRDHFYSLSV